jgi:enoyl-[acyl-carrier protein] reductase I
MARDLVWDGLQGAKRSNSHRYCEHLQRRRPPKARDARHASDLFSVTLAQTAGMPPAAAPPAPFTPFIAFHRRKTMGFLTGKKLLITGVLSNRSIAYGIAKACHKQGAELAFSYVGERFKDRITDFAAEFDSKLIFDCDVGSDEQIERMFTDLAKVWPKFDGFVHAIGFAPREAIAGNFLEGLSREGFRIAHDISAYSFPAMAKAALPHLNDKSSLLTLSYLGALRSIPNYNTMGLAKASLEASVRYLAEAVGRTEDGRSIRANGISAGPIKTLAASGIKDFGKLLGRVADAAPLRRNVTIEDVGNVAAFLLSDLASGVTAEITYVDGGFSQTAGLSADQV